MATKSIGNVTFKDGKIQVRPSRKMSVSARIQQRKSKRVKVVSPRQTSMTLNPKGKSK
jgi:hypothetical protein